MSHIHNFMREPITFNMKEYYSSWRKNSSFSSPWDREYLNLDFLKHEKKQIEKITEWYYKKFQKADENDVLPEISLYLIPVELSLQWKATINSLGNYNFRGLSALQNSPSIIMIGLFPHNIEKQPNEYSLINILKSKKVSLNNTHNGISVYALIIEEWEDLPSDSLYLDVPHEKDVLQKLFKKHISIGKSYTSSFQSPLIGAPYTPGSVGGISLASSTNNSRFAQDFAKLLQQIMPPEYRSIPPPQKAYLGQRFKYLDGISFHFAERSSTQGNYFSSFYDNSYNSLTQELDNRKKFLGEYSIFSTLISNYTSPREILKDMANNFTATEITLPEKIDEITDWADIDLNTIRSDINEDELWIQIANAHQIKPSIIPNNQEYVYTTKKIAKDFDAILSDTLKVEAERESTVNWMMSNTQHNIKRLAQSLARSTNKFEVTRDNLDDARGIIVDNFGGMVDNGKFDFIRAKLEKSKTDARFSIVQETIIILKSPTAREIYDEVKNSGLFSDMYDLQNLLDWMERKGQAIVDIHKRYIWI